MHDHSDSYENLLNAQSPRLLTVCIRVKGLVQGVGFRPFVYRLATDLGLSGSVCNKGGFVEIELVAVEKDVFSFIKRLKSEVPPIARIDRIELNTPVETTPNTITGSFEISMSQAQTDSVGLEISPDIATCKDCITELFDETDRRFGYPFLNCTNCGPRFTVIKALPFDRATTSMDCFPMCELCSEEYSNPRNRRFHAQPNACPLCGPRLYYCWNSQLLDETISFDNDIEEELNKAISVLSDGKILALKSLGGFQLVCDATNDDAINLLRKRKGREAKPFAVMMPSLKSIENYCHVSDAEAQILEGQFRPIVLLHKLGTNSPTYSKPEANAVPVSNLVAPQMNTLGVMLPYTPLHHLIMRCFGKPLVMTSANLSDEPIATGNREALLRVATIADAFLLHNRDITGRYDDTVTRVIDDSETLIRRARGYAPRAIDLAIRAKCPVLAMGGHMKNTFCLIKGTKAYISQHIGDLDTLESEENFRDTLGIYLRLFDVKPELLVVDLHPEYGSTIMAQSWLAKEDVAEFDIAEIRKTLSVQHHHAHIAGCMAEFQIDGPVIGVAFDGTGYGADRKLWGGEFLNCTFESFERVARFRNIRLPGGVKAIREPWRMALSYVANCSDLTRNSRSIERTLDRLNQSFGQNTVSSNLKLASSNLNPETSSCGRLFDAVSALLGLCDVALYEGHAAVLLESCAAKYSWKIPPEPYPLKIDFTQEDKQEIIEIDTISIVEAVIADLETGTESHLIAARFQETMANLISVISSTIRIKTEINIVCMSGGVFQNERLLCRAKDLLKIDGFEVYSNHLIPANDGGLSLGQAVIGLAQSGMMETTH
jgi:hydrogenase maturation protein HypF